MYVFYVCMYVCPRRHQGSDSYRQLATIAILNLRIHLNHSNCTLYRLQVITTTVMPNAHHFNLPLLPKFLLPPLVFRSRQSAECSSQSTTSRASIDLDPKRNEKYLNGHVSYLRCSRCATDLCLASHIISKGFTGRHGRAYLVSPEPVASAISISASSSPTASLPNTIMQKPVPRQLVTGAHTVSDISCASCGSVLGWKYVAAEEESQRYKVGKFILETQKTTRSSCWESPPSTDSTAPPNKSRGKDTKMPGDSIEFDSQDEEECEDLFAGIWDSDLAKRRRNRKLDDRPTTIGLG